MGNKRVVLCVFVLFLTLFASFAGADDSIVIHGLVSQGYLKTTDNNYLNLSEDGSAEFNEFIVNFQKQMDEKLRVGLQLLSRDLGKEGNNEVKVDWAYGDYRLSENAGVRFGRVKVPFGLYNQYRDIDMLRTTVLLPTTIYMEDYRTFITAFTGGSIYGTIPGEKGSLDLELAMGNADIDPDSGVIKDILNLINTRFEAGLTSTLPAPLQAAGMKFAHFGDPERDTNSKFCYSAKALWNTPIEGLKIGGNRTMVDFRLDEGLLYQPLITPAPGLVTVSPGFGVNVDMKLKFTVDVGSIEYTINKFTFAGEYMAAHQKQIAAITTPTGVRRSEGAKTSHGSYLQAVYKHNDKHEWGIYRGELFSDKNDKRWQEYHKDTCASYRYNITQDWSVKFEYHWFDGTGQLQSELNTGTMDRKWNMVALKTTYNF